MSSSSFEVKTKAVKAGAGAGKTYNLTIDVTQFAKNFRAHNERWPRVVVTTFTKKATQELSERILQKAIDTDAELLPFVNSGFYLQVSTIHGVLDRLLKECGSLLGLRRDFAYLSTAEALFLSKKVLKTILDEESQFVDLTSHYSFRDLHKLLSEAQDHPLEGYSFVSSTDLYELLTQNVKKTKNSLIEVLSKLQSETLTPKWQEVSGILESVVIHLDVKNWSVNQKRISELMATITLNGLKPRKEGSLLDLYASFKACVDQLRLYEESYYHATSIELAGKYNGQFQKLLTTYIDRLHEEKKSINKIEIADLEVFAQKLILAHKQAVQVYARNFDYWVIDEFQDTSPLQLELLSTLIGKMPYYIVGDPQQSIYLFRGARAEVFTAAVENIQKNNGEYLHLTKNYRSQEKVLETINYLSQKLGPAFSTMEATKPSENAAPALYMQPSCDEEQELDFLYRHVSGLIHGGAQLQDIAILVRKNDQLKQVGEFLSNRKIPVHLSSSGQFWRRREVLDSVILLKFLLNPYDENNLFSLLRMPFFACTDEDIVLWANTKAPLWSHLLETAKDASTVQLLQSLLDVTQEKGYVHGFIEALQTLHFFDKHFVYDPSGRSEGNVWMFIHKLRTFESSSTGNFYDFIAECEKAEFLEATSDAPGAIDNNKIAIMTIHAAKGLQFDHVLMPFLGGELYIENKKDFLVDEVRKKWCIRTPSSEDELSTSSSLYEKDILSYYKTRLQEEDLRLFYVAITRAIQSIYVSWKTDVKDRSWSHFFNELEKTPGTHTLKASAASSYQVYSNDLAGVDATPVLLKNIEIPAPYREREAVAETTAVTDFVEKATYKQTDANFYKIRLGILFHRLLETLAKPVDVDLRTTIVNWFGDDSEKVADALNYILQLEEPPMSRLLKEGKPEWGFLNKDGASYIQGQIDLWGIVDDTLWV
ncbi:MAG: UvrD-helicase domain-containing protein, partial [Bdellovibrionaceae bacterium]|nr:UvrD-helicase domain-containing protein [Pseudobdellovibrionaceae bacterium]